MMQLIPILQRPAGQVPEPQLPVVKPCVMKPGPALYPASRSRKRKGPRWLELAPGVLVPTCGTDCVVSQCLGLLRLISLWQQVKVWTHSNVKVWAQQVHFALRSASVPTRPWGRRGDPGRGRHSRSCWTGKEIAHCVECEFSIASRVLMVARCSWSSSMKRVINLSCKGVLVCVACFSRRTSLIANASLAAFVSKLQCLDLRLQLMQHAIPWQWHFQREHLDWNGYSCFSCRVQKGDGFKNQK